MDKVKRIKELTQKLNQYRDSYYNDSVSEISDHEYDELFDELKQLEEETNIVWIYNKQNFYELIEEFNFRESVNNGNVKQVLEDKIFVITGSLKFYKNRDELVNVIERNGGKVSGSVSAKTSYLINNDVASTSGKNKKAHDLGIPIISEGEFIQMITS